MKSGITTLGDVLINWEDYDPDGFLYLRFSEVWHSSTECAVLPESDVDGVPEFAKQHGLEYAVGVAAIHDVVANAKAQLGDVSSDQLLRAFLFYFDHDAYIALDT